MKNKQLKAFAVGTFVSLAILISFFLGGVADRLFVIKPLDYISKRVPAFQQPLGSNMTDLGRMVEETDLRTADVASKASDSVVTVSITQKQKIFEPSGSIFDNFQKFGFGVPGSTRMEEIQRDIGTGFVVEGGFIVTNKHVVADPQAEYSVIDSQDSEHVVTDIYRDPTLDLAILQAKDFSPPALPLGNSDDVKVGEPVIAIGTALGKFRHTLTKGVVSGLGRGITAQGASQVESLQGVIQTDAAVNPGNSGGPLINILSGQVIGVNVATTTAENISFAIPINVIKMSLKNFKETGQFDRPYLGLRYRMISERAALFNEVPQGVYVVEVLPGSSASEAGLEPGDIVLEVAGEKLDETNDLAQIINRQKVGDTIKVVYWRDGQSVEVKVELKSTKQ